MARLSGTAAAVSVVSVTVPISLVPYYVAREHIKHA